MAVLTPQPKMQFTTAAGVPLSGGKVYTYVAGTTTPQATYTDYTGATPNANPVILDSRGEANIWLGGALYKFRLTDANDVDIWTVDYISAPTSAVSPILSGNVTIDSDTPTPALKITQTGTGPVMRVQDSIDPDVTPFIIDADGNVGLGTAAPAQKLDVFNGVIRVGGSVQGQLLGYSSTNVYTMDLGVAVGTGAAGDVGFYNRTAGNAVFGTSNTERMRIDSSGNVGIGTNAPGYLLDVRSASNTTAHIMGTTSGVRVGASADTPVAGAGYVGTYSNHPAVFGANNAERFRISTSGNVGIGTSSPGSLLTVNGDIAFNSGYGSAAVAYGCRAWVNFNGSPSTGTYSRATNVITVILTSHGMTTGQSANFTFAAGTGGTATSGNYVVTVVDANTLTMTDTGGSGTITGSPSATRNTWIRGSGNVSSITDNGVGNYTINFTNAMPDTNYAASGMVRNNDNLNDTWVVQIQNTDTKSTTQFQFTVREGGLSTDSSEVLVMVVR